MGENDDDRERPAEEPTQPPRLPVRASIYIDVDGTVHFGALFEGLVPVAEALGNRRAASESLPGDATGGPEHGP